MVLKPSCAHISTFSFLPGFCFAPPVVPVASSLDAAPKPDDFGVGALNEEITVREADAAVESGFVPVAPEITLSRLCSYSAWSMKPSASSEESGRGGGSQRRGARCCRCTLRYWLRPAESAPLHADALDPFTTPNYKMTTTARIEWWFVEDPENGLKENRLDKWPFEDPSTISGSAVPRVPLPQKAFDLAFDEVNTNLIKLSMPTIMNSEFLGARMYTGPCFVKYNTVLRGLQVRSGTAQQKHTFLPHSTHHLPSSWHCRRYLRHISIIHLDCGWLLACSAVRSAYRSVYGYGESMPSCTPAHVPCTFLASPVPSHASLTPPHACMHASHSGAIQIVLAQIPDQALPLKAARPHHDTTSHTC